MVAGVPLGALGGGVADGAGGLVGVGVTAAATVTMEAGKYYKVEITGEANRTEKDMQLRLAWLTPETSASYDSATKTISGGSYDNAIELAKTNDKVVVFVNAKASDKPSTRDPDNLNISADQEQLIIRMASAESTQFWMVTAVSLLMTTMTLLPASWAAAATSRISCS